MHDHDEKRGPSMIFTSSLPFSKFFFAATNLPATTIVMLTRLIVASISHLHSAADASSAIRTDPRHRAQIIRFLARCRWSANWETLHQVADLLFQRVMAEKGVWVYVLDQTYHTTSGPHAQNAFSRGNKKKRAKKGDRKQKKMVRHKCHCFMYGLLISPETGTRIPSVRSYYTEEYCKQQAAKVKKGQQAPSYRTQPEIAAAMIVELRVPAKAQVLVLGDTAFEAATIRAACQQRGFDWITPANPERVLTGSKPRRKLTDKSKDLSSEAMTRIELCPDQTEWCPHLRGSKSKARRNNYSRLYWAHAETLDVHNVGRVGVVFSTTKEPQAGQSVNVQKILLTNRTDWSLHQIVSAYSVRWQIELFFKEMKSFLGLSSYRMRDFKEVEGWVQACTIAFVYLEWYRLEVGERKQLKEWWRLRVSGLIRLVRQDIEETDLRCVAEQMETADGRAWLRERFAKALPAELRRAS
jgi:hypothetical protein